MLLVESELFDFLKEFYYPDLEKSKSKFATFDCVSGKQRLYIELKSRNTHYNDLLIEKMKYDAIMGAALFLGYAPSYINSTPDGVWQFDLSTLPEPVWSERPLPQNTEFEDRGKKNKVVGYLHIKDGVKL